MVRGSIVPKVFVAALLLGSAFISAAARGGDSPADQKLSNIEGEIKRLQKELSELKGSDSPAAQKPAPAPAASSDSSANTSTSTDSSDKAATVTYSTWLSRPAA